MPTRLEKRRKKMRLRYLEQKRQRNATEPLPTTMSTEEGPKLYKSLHHDSKILQKLYDQRNRPHSMCDMMLIGMDQPIPVHRAVVTAASPFLRSILIDTISDGIYSSVLLLSEYKILITSEALEILVGYMYKGSIELAADNIDIIMEAASTLQMNELKQFCKDYKELQLSFKRMHEEKAAKAALLWNERSIPKSSPLWNEHSIPKSAPLRNEHSVPKSAPPWNEHSISKSAPPWNEHSIPKSSPPWNEHSIHKSVPLGNEHSISKSAPPWNEHSIPKSTPPWNEHSIPKSTPPWNEHSIPKSTPPWNEHNIPKSAPLGNEHSIPKSSPSWNEHIIPFRCKYCSQTFCQLDIYKRHSSSHESIYRKHWSKKFAPSQSEHHKSERRSSRYSLRDRSKLKMIESVGNLSDVEESDPDDDDYVILEKGSRNKKQDTTKTKYACPIRCGRSFSGIEHLYSHLQKECKVLDFAFDTGSYRCNLCQEVFKFKDNIIRHLQNHRAWKCKCSKTFGSEGALNRHRLVHKEIYKRSAYLNKVTGGQETQHEPVHKESPKSMVCSQCNEQCKSKSELRAHVADMHSNFRCPICGRSHTCESQLRTHLNVHRTDRPYKCNKCGKGFKQKYTFLSHERYAHSRKKLRCEYCNKTFKWKGCLKTHLRKHTGEKPFTCIRCGEKFLYKYRLEKHQKIHSTVKEETVDQSAAMRGENVDQNASPVRRGRTRSATKALQKPQHKCDHCNASFFEENDLTDHLRTDHMIQTMPKFLLGGNFFLDDW